MGPTPRATPFNMKWIDSVTMGGRTAAWLEAPNLDAVLADTGLTVKAVLNWENAEIGQLPRGAGATRERLGLRPSGWSRLPGFICRRRASWAGGSCAWRKIARSTSCTAAAARWTRPSLPR